MRFYVNWAKARLDKTDATLASLEAKAGEQTAFRAKAEQRIAQMSRQRDAFRQSVAAHAEASEGRMGVRQARTRCRLLRNKRTPKSARSAVEPGAIT